MLLSLTLLNKMLDEWRECTFCLYKRVRVISRIMPSRYKCRDFSLGGKCDSGKFSKFQQLPCGGRSSLSQKKQGLWELDVCLCMIIDLCP